MTTQTLLLATGFSLLFGLVFGSIELIKRKLGVPAEIMRRVAHIASGFLLILDYLYLPPVVFVVLVASGGVTFFVLSRLKLLTAVNAVARRTIGQYLLTYGYLAAYFCSLPDLTVFIPSVLIVTFADSLAGLTGTLLKSPRKTWVGSSVFFVVALALILATAAAPIWPAMAIAGALAVVERFSPLGFDNLTVPVASALLLLAF